MFITSSKLYLGLAFLALVVLGILGWATGWAFPVTAAMTGLGAALVFLGGLVLAEREVTSMSVTDEAAERLTEPAVVRGSLWPLVTGFGVAFSLVGLVTGEGLFLLGLVFLVAGLIEWAIQAYAERASADLGTNQAVRGQLLRPAEFPVLGLLIGALVVFGFSRIMLTVTKVAAIAVFIIVALVVLGVALLIAAMPRLGRPVIGGLLAIGAVAALIGGVAGAARGERTFEEHESACDAREPGEKTSVNVSNKSNPAADLVFDGETVTPERFTLPKANWSTVLFTNESDEPAQLLIEGTAQPVLDEEGNPVTDADGQTITAPELSCTDFIEDEETQSVTFRINLPGRYPYKVLVGESREEAAVGVIEVS